MYTAIIIPIVTAFWLGILAAVSPCPLATNIAATSFLSKRIGKPGAVFRCSIFYTIGRISAYTILGLIIILSLVKINIIAIFLQKYMNKILGPILVLAGFFLLDILSFSFNKKGSIISVDKFVNSTKPGIWSAALLGILFAFSFCPISAALFFGSLIPLSLSTKVGIILPAVFGLATGLPVIVFAIIAVSGAKALADWFNKVTNFERYARKITGIIFILAGLYYIWVYWGQVFAKM